MNKLYIYICGVYVYLYYFEILFKYRVGRYYIILGIIITGIDYRVK